MKVRILLVDDDQQFRSMLSEVLTQAGYQVQEAVDGAEAVRLFKNQPTDLVITDLIMPEKEGLETITELKQFYPEVKIIAISGGGRNGPQDYIRMAMSLGAKRALAKPFSHQEILEAISQVLQGL